MPILNRFALILMLASLGFELIVAPGCATFHGPGRINNGTAEGESSSAKGSPGITLRGERQTESPVSHINFDWPVDQARLSRGFLLGPRRPHWGLDLANHKGTPILAAEHGVVIYTGRGFHGYGNLIVIEHNEQWATLYGHLDKILVREGEPISRGQQIATMGRTGRASGYHLHFEIRNNRQPVNPLALLPQGF
jgi:murein DD-endopeptidase MepM/ murein hydrolase activator NlpD